MSDEQFPINISADELAEFFLTAHKELHSTDFYEKLNNDDNFQKKYFEEMKRLYIRENYPIGIFVIIERAKKILDGIKNESGIKWILGEFEIDLTHMMGLPDNEMHLVVIPFNDVESAWKFVSAIKNIKKADIFENGQKVEKRG